MAQTQDHVSTYPCIYKPNFSTYQMRLKTFDNWSAGTQQTPHDFASCGFFYTGENDKVCCFYCGIGLYHWKSSDNVWVEHALFSPKRTFLWLNKFKCTQKRSETTVFEKLLVR